MLLAERAGRKLERRSNSAPRGMAVIARVRKGPRRNKIRPIGLLHLIFNVGDVRKLRRCRPASSPLSGNCADADPHPRPRPGHQQFARHPVRPPGPDLRQRGPGISPVFSPPRLGRARPMDIWHSQLAAAQAVLRDDGIGGHAPSGAAKIGWKCRDPAPMLKTFACRVGLSMLSIQAPIRAPHSGACPASP